MNIRKAEIDDFLSIALLDRSAWGDNRNSQFIPDGEHAWRLWVEHALVFCSENKGKITGAILAFPTVKQTYCVHKVFVSSNTRGFGIGGKLFAALLKEIDNNKKSVFLTVDPKNLSAISLYEKWGFSEQKYVSGYYRKEEDRLVLTRAINQ